MLVVLIHEGVFLVISNSRGSFLEIFMPFDPQNFVWDATIHT